MHFIPPAVARSSRAIDRRSASGSCFYFGTLSHVSTDLSGWDAGGVRTNVADEV